MKIFHLKRIPHCIFQFNRNKVRVLLQSILIVREDRNIQLIALFLRQIQLKHVSEFLNEGDDQNSREILKDLLAAEFLGLLDGQTVFEGVDSLDQPEDLVDEETQELGVKFQEVPGVEI